MCGQMSEQSLYCSDTFRLCTATRKLNGAKYSCSTLCMFMYTQCTSALAAGYIAKGNPL